jgi:hypothetical protein
MTRGRTGDILGRRWCACAPVSYSDSSWDDSAAMRHGVPFVATQAFLIVHISWSAALWEEQSLEKGERLTVDDLY